jgi:hypothetical protein
MDDRDDSMQAWAHQQEIEHRYFEEVIMIDTWNRCDVCGKFIALDDFDNGAIRELITPDSHLSSEEWETLCKKHADKNSTERGN